MKLGIDVSWRVTASHDVEIPLSDVTVWGQMRDYMRFLTLDPLHVKVSRVESGAASPRGDRLVISHRLLGLGPDRVGRVLTWREGKGYAISDISRAGRRRGFPHVCTYEIRSRSPKRTVLRIGARGRWTATWMPRWAARMWLWWVLRATGAHIEMEFARLVAWRASHQDDGVTGTPPRTAEQSTSCPPR